MDQILPGNRELLPIVQEKGWTQLLLGWLNLHDRPAVQVEALLALTSIADLCQQSPNVTDTPSLTPVPGPTATGMSMDGAMNITQHLMQRGVANVPNAPPQYNPYVYPYMPWNFDPSQPNNITPQMLNDPAVQAAINGGYFQNLINPAAATTAATTPLPPQPSSFANSGVPNPASIIGNFSQPMSQNLLLNNAEALPTLISLLDSPNREVHEHAMWILGNIAAAPSGSSSNSGLNSINDPNDKVSKASAKEVLLSAGVMTPLLSCLEKNPQNLSLQRIGSWAISNLVETKMQQGKSGKSPIDGGGNFEIDICLLIPTLRRLLGSADHEILNYTCWALSHLCDGPASHISAVVTTINPKDPPCGLVPRLVQLLHHEDWKVTKPALRTIGNIVCAEYDEDSGDKSSAPTDFTEVILECDAVPRLKRLIAHNNREIQKEACWTLSNIAAGTVDQIQAVIDSGAIPPLVQLVNDKKTDQEVRSEACWVVLNATSCGSDQQISVLVSEGCVSVLGLLLEETTMVSMALEGLERVLQVEKNHEIARKEKTHNNERPRSPLVNPSLVENAMKKPNSNKVTKKVQQIWNEHFVSCALCNKPYSKHRTSDAKFCEECKCHVCCHCNCEVYHLSYQEELWAATEEKVTASKQAKKSKKQKKREKRKEKNKTKVQVSKPSSDSDKAKGKKYQISDEDEDVADNANDADNTTDQNSTETEKSQPPIDFSLYLQQTGSIIALARVMDDFYDGNNLKKYNEDTLSSPQHTILKMPNQ
jgi:importin subunit alpha-1